MIIVTTPLILALTGEFWLIDPVFSERASAFKWLAPKRFHPTPIALDQLPKIRGVIISHDHYDHLDRETIMQLKDQVAYFVTPLGVGQHLRLWGVEPDRIHELDWWQDVSFGKVKLTATPTKCMPEFEGVSWMALPKCFRAASRKSSCGVCW